MSDQILFTAVISLLFTLLVIVPILLVLLKNKLCEKYILSQTQPNEVAIISHQVEIHSDTSSSGGCCLKYVIAIVSLNGVKMKIRLKAVGNKSIDDHIEEWFLDTPQCLFLPPGKVQIICEAEDQKTESVQKCIQAVKDHTAQKYALWLAEQENIKQREKDRSVAIKEKQARTKQSLLSRMSGVPNTALSHAEQPGADASKGLSRLDGGDENLHDVHTSA